LTFITNDEPLFSTSPWNDDWFDMVICYRRPIVNGSEHLSSLEGAFLDVGRLIIPDPESHSLEFCVYKLDFERCFDDETGRIQSLVVGSQTNGDYSFPGWVDGIRGDFADSDGRINFAVEFNDSYVDVLSFRLPSTSRFKATAILGVAAFSLVPDRSWGIVSRAIDMSDCISDSLLPVPSIITRSENVGLSVVLRVRSEYFIVSDALHSHDYWQSRFDFERSPFTASASVECSMVFLDSNGIDDATGERGCSASTSLTESIRPGYSMAMPTSDHIIDSVLAVLSLVIPSTAPVRSLVLTVASEGLTFSDAHIWSGYWRSPFDFERSLFAASSSMGLSAVFVDSKTVSAATGEPGYSGSTGLRESIHPDYSMAMRTSDHIIDSVLAVLSLVILSTAA
jgi:hypothetical protein